MEANKLDPLRSIKAWVKFFQRPPAMIYADTFSLLFAVVGNSSVNYENSTKALFEMPAMCYSGNRKCQLVVSDMR